LAIFSIPNRRRLLDRELTSSLFYPSNCANALGFVLAFGLFVMTPSMGVLKVHQERHVVRDDLRHNADSVLIYPAPPLSASKPDRISSLIDRSAGLRTPSSPRCAMPGRPCLKAF
jgi:hypothetical protein